MGLNWIKLERKENGTAFLSLNRPEKRNALSVSLLEELCLLTEELSREAEMRVLILKGEGPIFCAGLDLQEVADPSFAERSAFLMSRILTDLHEAHYLTIAAVHGAAIAGGAGIMSVCDFTIAAEGTLIGFPEVHKGLIPALVSAVLTQRLLNRDLKELLLLGEFIEAYRAKEMGLIYRIVPIGELIEAALKLANQLLKGAPHALLYTKRLLEEMQGLSFADAIQNGLVVHQQMRQAEEAQEGVQAFLEKRDPVW